MAFKYFILNITIGTYLLMVKSCLSYESFLNWNVNETPPAVISELG